MPECAARRIECYSQMTGLFLLDEFEDIFCESEQYGHVSSFGVDHWMSQECVIHLENERVPVYQKESLVHRHENFFIVKN